MTQATRVYITPPTNTSLTRRGALGGAVAALAAGAAVNVTTIVVTRPAAADAAHDPVYDLIKAFHAASAAHTAALEEEARLALTEAPAWWDERAGIACVAHNAAFWALIETRPTTLAGVIALLNFLNELSASEDSHLIVDVDGGGLVLPLVSTLADALRDIKGAV